MTISKNNKENFLINDSYNTCPYLEEINNEDD